MAESRKKHLRKIYKLSDQIRDSRGSMLSIVYNEHEGGIRAEKDRTARMEKLRVRTNSLTITRQDEIRRLYSGLMMKEEETPSPQPSSRPASSVAPPRTSSPTSSTRSTTPEPQPRRISSSSSSRTTLSKVSSRKASPTTTPRSLSLVVPPPDKSPSIAPSTPRSSPDPEPPEEPSKWSTEPVPVHEKAYYEKCRLYYNITQQPIVSVSESLFYNHGDLPIASLICYVDEAAEDFNVDTFMDHLSRILRIDDIVVSKIQSGCVKITCEIHTKVNIPTKKIEVKALYDTMTDDLLQSLGKLNILFMFMGDIADFDKAVSMRDQITLFPQWNRIYSKEHMYWSGGLQDDRDRGPHPYFCPEGWQRYSLYVTENFDDKFKGWSVCYHGTKFVYGLSILLSGLKPAQRAEHGAGIYASPSINYAAHPRYAEVKQLASSYEHEFFKHGKYVQFVLQCRVNPAGILIRGSETLHASNVTIDPNVDNNEIEWLIDAQGKALVNFNDPNANIVCTGLMVRVTDEHPGLLPESQWWYESHLCNNTKCCVIGIDYNQLLSQKQHGDTSHTIFS